MNKKVINIVLTLFILFFLILLGYSGYNIFLWHNDNKATDTQIEEIEELTDVKEVGDNKNTKLINPAPNKEDPYWDYIKMKLIDVDLSKLKQINNELVGWIQVLGTNINYPFVQTKDNKYYLTHQFDKKSNPAGWVFMDYRNNLDDKNTIIYAHGRLNKTMFGSLRNVVKKSWYKNLDNHIVKVSTEKENTLWQVFSTYQIKTTNDYLKIDFDDDEYIEFLNKLKERSVYDYNVTLTTDDRILTLSTCHNDTDKIVLHAKLIKQEIKTQ